MGKRVKKAEPSNVELIELIRKETKELGRIPLKKDFQYGPIIHTRFGTWKEFLLAAGLKTTKAHSREKNLTFEDLVELAQKRAEELGRAPRMNEFRYSQLAKRTCGSWREFIKRAGLDAASIQSTKKIIIEELTELVQEKAEELGRPPRMSEFRYSQLAKNTCGSWQDFLKRAGLDTASVKLRKQVISDQQLIDLVKKRAEQLGRTPTKKEFKESTTAAYRFGNWKKFLEKAELKPGMRLEEQKISNELLISEVIKKTEELGRTPTNEQFNYGKLAVKRYGSWKGFLKHAGLEPGLSLEEASISNQELVEAFSKKSALLGHLATKKEFEHSKLAVRRYGSWKNFLKSAELMPLRYDTISDEELITLVQKQAAESGGTVRFLDFTHKSLVIKRFGTWGAFLKEAGLDFSRSQPDPAAMSEEELLAAFKKCAAELGETPTKADFHYSQIATQKFGSWTKFLEEAGMKPRSMPSNADLIKSVQKRAKELGRVPRMKDFKYSRLATVRYKGWTKFLIRAGLKTPRINNITKEPSNKELIASVHKKKQELGRNPLRSEFTYGEIAAKRYEGWDNFLASAGLSESESSIETDITNEELVALARKAKEELKRTPLMKEFEHGKLARLRYGTWNNFLEEAGLSTHPIPSPQQESFRSWLRQSFKKE